MAVAMAAMVPPAPAAFLYVPPGGSVEAPAHGAPAGADIGSTAAERTAVRTVAPGLGENADAVATELSGTAARAAGTWQVRAGETLRDVMDRWAGRAGTDVLFLTDRRYRLHEARTFRGPFAEATQALLTALSHLPHAPVGERRSGGRTLAILHRTWAAGEAR